MSCHKMRQARQTAWCRMVGAQRSGVAHAMFYVEMMQQTIQCLRMAPNRREECSCLRNVEAENPNGGEQRGGYIRQVRGTVTNGMSRECESGGVRRNCRKMKQNQRYGLN